MLDTHSNTESKAALGQDSAGMKVHLGILAAIGIGSDIDEATGPNLRHPNRWSYVMLGSPQFRHLPFQSKSQWGNKQSFHFFSDLAIAMKRNFSRS